MRRAATRKPAYSHYYPALVGGLDRERAFAPWGSFSSCVLVVFEAVPPFRGVEARGTPELIHRDVTSERATLAGRYLGEDGSRAFAVGRKAKPGVLLRLAPDNPRVWDLSAILPADIANPS